VIQVAQPLVIANGVLSVANIGIGVQQQRRHQPAQLISVPQQLPVPWRTAAPAKSATKYWILPASCTRCRYRPKARPMRPWCFRIDVPLRKKWSISVRPQRGYQGTPRRWGNPCRRIRRQLGLGDRDRRAAAGRRAGKGNSL